MIDGFLWIPVDMMGQVQKMMKYQGDEKPVLFQNLAFVVKPRLLNWPYNFAGLRFSWYILYMYMYSMYVCWQYM